VQLVSNLLIAILLGIGVAHGASAPNKPYKVCPIPPEDKDFPCVAMEASSTISIRGVAAPSPLELPKSIPPAPVQERVIRVEDKTEVEKLRQLIAMKDSEIKALKEEVKLLQDMLRDLMDREIKKDEVQDKNTK
jgi:hypothetical protein